MSGYPSAGTAAIAAPITESAKAIAGYRPDIDGLRAIAVLAVLVFHCFPTLVPGGFVGVDVFFVISGYLIGRSTFIELSQGRYSLASYFARRARRIFPALLVVLASVGIAGWWILMPNEFKLLGKHIAGASVFISNWQFWREVGYFDTEATLKPLLHLWSLAVEEQFYLLLPLLLLVAVRKGRNPLVPLVALALFSFVAVTVRLADYKAWSYFNLLSRGWELLIGVLLAHVEVCRKDVAGTLLPARARSWAGLAGVLAIAMAAFAFSGATPFPGPAALLPTVGAALVIAAGPGAAGNRLLLAWRPVAYVGLISYPLYLWHWPMLALLRTVDGNGLDLPTRLGVFAVTFPLAILTYHGVERPLRFSVLAQTRFFPALLWAALLAVGAAGYACHTRQGVPGRFDELDTTEQGASPAQVMPGEGFASASKAILLGDSHAMMYAEALRSYYYRAHGQELVYAFRGGCKPLYNLDKHRPGEPPQGCPSEVNAAIEQAVGDPKIDTILLVSALVSFNYYIYPGITEPPSPDLALNNRIVDRAIDDTFARLVGSGKRVVVFYTTPMLDFPPVQCQRRPFRWRTAPTEPCEVARRHYDDAQEWSRRKLQELAARYPRLVVFDPAPSLCDAQACRGRAAGKLIYSDPIHLNPRGAEVVSARFDF